MIYHRDSLHSLRLGWVKVARKARHSTKRQLKLAPITLNAAGQLPELAGKANPLGQQSIWAPDADFIEAPRPVAQNPTDR